MNDEKIVSPAETAKLWGYESIEAFEEDSQIVSPLEMAELWNYNSAKALKAAKRKQAAGKKHNPLIRALLNLGKSKTLKILVATVVLCAGITSLSVAMRGDASAGFVPTRGLSGVLTRGIAANYLAKAAGAAFAAVPYIPADMSLYFDMAPYDMPMWFEVRNTLRNDIVNMDGAYIAAGRLQFNAAPGFPLDCLLKSRATREKFGTRIDAFGGMAAIQAREPRAIAGLKALLRDAEFDKLYFDFADGMYRDVESRMMENYGIDLSGRHPVIVGLFRAIANHRYNDTLKVARGMCQEAVGARLGIPTNRVTDAMIRKCSAGAGLNSISDAEFLGLAEKALAAMIDGTLRNKEQRRQAKNNYSALIDRFGQYMGKTHMPRAEQEKLPASRVESYLVSVAEEIGLTPEYGMAAKRALDLTLRQMDCTDIARDDFDIGEIQALFTDNLIKAATDTMEWIPQSDGTFVAGDTGSRRRNPSMETPFVGFTANREAGRRDTEDEQDIKDGKQVRSGLLARAIAIRQAGVIDAQAANGAVSRGSSNPAPDLRRIKKAMERGQRGRESERLSRAARIVARYAGALRG
jgi:hypothetical protein